jgi:hypothetical protein
LPGRSSDAAILGAIECWRRSNDLMPAHEAKIIRPQAFLHADAIA